MSGLHAKDLTGDKVASTVYRRIQRTSWWWGSVLFALVATALPYWLWGIFGSGRGWIALWRIPVAPNGVFDSYAYFQQMGMLKAGIQTGTFGWFAWPLLGLMRLIPSASIPEIWILSRWVTTFLLMWTGAWCIRRVTGASKNVSRWLIVCFWLSFLLVIGLRPGVFSWDLPFGFLGLGLSALAADALRSDRWMKSVAYSIVALFLFAIYPWFLIYGVSLFAVLYAVRIIQTRPRWWVVLVATSVFFICVFAILFATGKAPLHLPASFGTYERSGLTFSYMPLISNTIIACVLWLGLLLWARSRRMTSQDRATELLSWFWIVVLVIWVATPLAGVYLQSDHFVIIVAMLTWLSAAWFVPLPSGDGRPRSTRIERTVSLAIAIFSSLFFLYILIKGLRQVGKIETFTIHLSIWLSLAWSAWFHWYSTRGGNVDAWWKRSRWLLLAICLFLGSIGLRAVVVRWMPVMPDLEQRIPAITWIQQHVPLNEAVCSDPVGASIYGAHNERMTYPEESNIILTETDDAQHRRLMIIGAAYDVVASGDEHRYPYLINGLRTAACEQFVKVGRLLERFHLSRTTIDQFLGCQQRRADAYEEEVMTAIAAHQVDAPAFRVMCPWVVIPDDRKQYWNLPGSYEEIRVDSRTSIWRAR